MPIPMLAMNGNAMIRLDHLEETVEQGKSRIAEGRDNVECAALIYDGRVTGDSIRRDALVCLAVESPSHRLSAAAGHERGAPYGPAYLDETDWPNRRRTHGRRATGTGPGIMRLRISRTKDGIAVA